VTHSTQDCLPRCCLSRSKEADVRGTVAARETCVEPSRAGYGAHRAAAAGVAFAVTAGCAWVSVAFAGRSVGRRTRRVDGLALAIPIACLVTLPFGIGHAGALDARALTLGLVIAVGGMILPFALELEGLRRLEPRLVAVIYSADPAIAALIGLVALSQSLTPPEVLGMAAVIAASVGVTAGAAEA
jgi:inner membrane transporter RhtA